MIQADDNDRLIQEVLIELGSEEDAKVIAEKVRQLNLGLPAEDEFTAVCSWLGKASLIHKLDQLQTPLRSRENYQVPDLIIKFENTRPLLVEVKVKKGQTLSFRPDYLARLEAYAELLNMPLLIAWKHHGLWILFEARHLIQARKNFNIRFEDALRENLLGVLAGNLAYNIAPGAGVRTRFKKEELLSVEKDGSTISEQRQMRVDQVGFLIADGEPVDVLDPDVTTLFTTWELEEYQTHSETHIELEFVAGIDGMMFGHMALVHLLNWP